MATLSGLCVALALGACAEAPGEPGAPPGPVAPVASDPVGLVAHGVIYDPNHVELHPDRELVRSAQAYYLARLEALADDATRARLADVRARLAGDVSEGEQVYLDDTLIRWLAAAVNTEESTDLLGKSLALYAAYERLTVEPGVPMDETRAAVEGGVSHLVEAAGLLPARARALPATYQEQCRAARVPVPPDWGTAAWKFAGTLSDSQEFIVVPDEAQVYYYESSSPRGVCIALPRKGVADDGRTLYTALGIICHGVETSKACFWDDKDVEIGATRPIAFFRQGNTAEISGNGKCTDCHAGNNPFIIHPDTALNLRRGNLVAAANWDPVNWVDPLIYPTLPQNPGPTNVFLGKPVADANSCASGSCQSASAQRQLPEMYKGSSWCSPSVVLTAMEGRAATPDTPAAPKTMPPAGIGGNFATHIAAVKSRCQKRWAELCSPDNAKICAQAGGYCERAVSTTNFRTDICRWPNVTQATCQTKTAGFWVTAAHPQAALWPSWRKPDYLPAAAAPADACVRQMTMMGGNVGGTVVADPPGTPDTIIATCSSTNRDKCRARGGSCELYKNAAGATVSLCRWPNAKTQATCDVQAGVGKWRLAASAWFTTYKDAVRASAPNACMDTP